MGASRTIAALLIGLGAAWPAQANEPAPAEAPTAATAAESETLALRPTAGTNEFTLPTPPEVMVNVPAAATLDLPSPPDAPVVLTAADTFGPALAQALADGAVDAPLHLRKGEREAIAAFYALGGFKPLFVEEGRLNARASHIVVALKGSGEDGFDPSDYAEPVLAADGKLSAADLAMAELKLAAAAVHYARDARGGRIDPTRLSRLITPTLELPTADAVLTALATASDPGAVMASFQPPHAGYRALKRKLAEVKAREIREPKLEADILANMERWRWLPADLGRRHIFVNVPEYKLRLVEQGRTIHEARVIVGRPDTQTPIFSDEMDHAVVNPSWYVPPSIFKTDFKSDPALAAARGYDVIRGKNGAVTIRQPPSERNALGLVKFMFPNQHSVYIHDTPNRNLFSAERRAFSHGCVRLEQPFRFGEFVLGADWTEQRLRRLVGAGERRINLPQKIPVHLTYFTLVVDEAGELREIADIYGTNAKVRVALSHGGMAAPAAIAAKPKTARPAANRAPRRPSPGQTGAIAATPARVQESFFPLWMSR